jgi:hypothetical protein
MKMIRTPVQAPNVNAYAERWIRTLRADCLDRILILGRRHVEVALPPPLCGVGRRSTASWASWSCAWEERTRSGARTVRKFRRPRIRG